ncbi:aspartyl/asparaginyl beta-hydroxylase domain-containing protein [Legionella micdadei]|uniref:Beta-hydroxylase n=1 Tax=Legionella micdadei TaxID=451 RepID=A0A098GEL2_LEGMI|nr:aspartyl/asparaginyl beta-hydroxylase domain-containing protein [Legionella micdadei]ARG97524.1 aspartyl beta-hydroxylase [Legionella micdadei]ARH00166.1 aspartyl beta-hydroxylase [Legionella micdadei]KTD27597.1 peptide aspartate b-dioxygenase [Legionella micdadei]NSL17579.1 aspartyl/asparaginyl beta-hydroxylase domain-containing protein [Legionella micdadei]CEG60918.1 Putative Aspartyl/Asparaginyl beta-hydroxylase [Legionella micdadei]
MTYLSILNFKTLFFASYIFSIAYTHLRGKVRLKFLHQLTDHSSLMAPVNAIMYLFSSVPKTPFLDLANFPELKLLRDNWQTIREEAEYLYKEGYISASEKYDDIGFNSFFRRGWKRFYLKWYQEPMHSAQTLCPKSLELIEKIPNINAAMFTLLPKDSFLFKHRDPYAGSLRYHLGLITPNSKECCIYVDGEPYFWQDGQDVLFDETYVHHAENKTSQDRIILFCDIQRPLNNALANRFNRFFSRTVMKAASSKNLPNERVGLINKLFTYIYQIRLVGKKLKSYNKNLYYIIKYALFISLIALFII